MSTIFKGIMGGFDTLIEQLPDGCLSIMQTSKKDDSLDDPHYVVEQVVLDDDAIRDLLVPGALASGNC